MKKNINIVILLALTLSFMGCEDMFDPRNENYQTFDRVYEDPAFAEGILLSAYVRLPLHNLAASSDVATDDAVTNENDNAFRRVGTGEWSAINDPLSTWNSCNTAMIFLDQFIGIIDTVEWKWTSEELNELYKKRFKGEAYAMRGMLMYHLLQTVGGYDNAGNLLGAPLYKDDGDFNILRPSFAESVTQVYEDFDTALEYLTMDDYRNISSTAQLPAGYEGNNVDNYNAVFGSTKNQRISGRIVKAYKARMALLAASPAFSPNDDAAAWERAANYAGEILQTIGGVSGLDPNGHVFYRGDLVDAISLASGNDSKETVWRRAIVENRTKEENNYPPSLFGRGRVNPSQNLVDAFPMANGLPITDPASGYDAATPYVDRDPRLALYIAYNGNTVGGQQIFTQIGSGSNAKDSIATSTRTGYYLKKLLRDDVSANPASANVRKNFDVYIRYTELFLAYAEAANEAWGPTGMGSFGFSARDVIEAIRQRAGITTDSYLSSVTTREQMRELIRNERRLELCFEGFRFWDMRRWKLDLNKLNETVKGIDINTNGSIRGVVDVEDRRYQDFMYYGPIPESEQRKFPILVQNRGW